MKLSMLSTSSCTFLYTQPYTLFSGDKMTLGYTLSHAFVIVEYLNQHSNYKEAEYSTRMRAAHFPSHTCLSGHHQMSVPLGVVLRWTSLNIIPVMANKMSLAGNQVCHVWCPEAAWVVPCLMSRGVPVPGVGLCSEVQCIMGNDNMGPPPPSGQTDMTENITFPQLRWLAVKCYSKEEINCLSGSLITHKCTWRSYISSSGAKKPGNNRELTSKRKSPVANTYIQF